MNLEVRSAFAKAAKKLPLEIQIKVASVVEQIMTAKALREIENCKKLKGHKTAYRIKVDVYRLGFFYEKGTVELTTILHRKEIYRYFP